MKSLLCEYQFELKRTRQLKKKTPADTPEEKEKHRIISGMITDLEIAVDWLETGRPPSDRRGIYGTTATEPMILNSIADRSIAGLPKNAYDSIERQIDISLDKGKAYGFDSQETYAYLRWRKERQQLQKI